MTPRCEKLAKEILYICSTQGRSTVAGKLIDQDTIIQQFSKNEKPSVKSVIKNYLLKMKYLDEADVNSANPTYTITKRGELQLITPSGTSSITISNSSNTAINSPHTTQTFNVTNQSAEIQQLVTKFDEAVKTRDADAMKKTFGYIADKSIDLAIALTTGALVR